MLCCLVYTRLGWSVSFFWSLALFGRHSVFLFCLRVLCMFVLFNCLFRLLTVWSYCDVDFVVFLVLLLLCWFMFSVFLSLPSIFSLSSYRGFVIRVVSTFGVTSGDKFRVLICGDGSCHRRITGVLGNICLFCLYLFSVLFDLLLCGHPSCHLLILPLVCFLSVPSVLIVWFDSDTSVFFVWVVLASLFCLGFYCPFWPCCLVHARVSSRPFAVQLLGIVSFLLPIFPFSFSFYSCICFLFLFSLFVLWFSFYLCVSVRFFYVTNFPLFRFVLFLAVSPLFPFCCWFVFVIWFHCVM